MPYKFTIVIPVFNREAEVSRAIESCLGQHSTSYEIILVDDASQDGSVAAIQPYTHLPNVLLVSLAVNEGEWGARAAGVARATGEWIIFLDSDDELVPNALSIIAEAIEQHGDAQFRLGFSYRHDDGTRSPYPITDTPLFLAFTTYIRWQADAVRTDALWVTRARTFKQVPIPKGRRVHSLYHFTFNATFGTLLLPAIVGIVHTDATNTLTLARGASTTYVQRLASDQASEADHLLAQFGSEIQQASAAIHRKLSRSRIVSRFVLGQHAKALRCWIDHIRFHRDPASLCLPILSVLGTSTISKIRLRRQRATATRASALSSMKGRA